VKKRCDPWSENLRHWTGSNLDVVSNEHDDLVTRVVLTLLHGLRQRKIAHAVHARRHGQHINVGLNRREQGLGSRSQVHVAVAKVIMCFVRWQREIRPSEVVVE
jgi:hypothetical protein